jgi:hypothetical protein
MKKITLITITGLAAVALGASACGGTSEDEATAASATTTESTTEVAQEVPEVSAEERQANTNERIADQMASVNGGKNLAVICKNMPLIGRAATERMFTTQLGALVIREDGDVGEVADLLLDRC